MESVTSQPAPSKRKPKSFWMWIAAVMAKIGQFVKMIKLASLALMVVSALCFAGTLTFYEKISVAFGVTLLLFLHEMGHAISLYRLGFGFRYPIFIPFLGAAIFAPDKMTRREEATMAYAGPLWGTAACFVYLLPYFIWPSQVWLTTATIGMVINLFNMTPAVPMDGGRILRALYEHLKWLGLVVLFAFTMWLQDPGMLIFWIIVIQQIGSIPAKAQFIACGLCALGLFSAIFLYHGDHAFGRLVFEFILGAFFTLASYREAFHPTPDEIRPLITSRPYGKMGERAGWGILWVALVFLQIAGFLGAVFLSRMIDSGSN